jgi:DNA primase large subunit
VTYQSLKEEDPDWTKFQNSITFRSTDPKVNASDFIKVPFKEALSLVARRQVFVNKGIAYVPITELFSIASS